MKTTRPSKGEFHAIRDTSPTLPWIDPVLLQEALGAEPTDVELPKYLAPVTLFAVREELAKRLQSSGGRPALAGATRRAKVPLSDEQWLQLEEMAAAASSAGFAPTAGQVASVLLTLSLRSVTSQMAKGSPIQNLAEPVPASKKGA